MKPKKTSFLLVFLCFFAVVFRCSGDGRRVLHEPLVPIDWSAPPPPDDLPEQSPNPLATTPADPANNNAGQVQPSHRRSSPPAAAKVAIGISASVAALVLVSVLAFFVYRRRVRKPPDTEKLVGRGHARRFSSPLAGPTVASSDVLYLGTMEPSSSRELKPGEHNGGSPYRKLSSARGSMEGYQPSPELHPLPPLVGPDRTSAQNVVMSDEDAFYTPQPSAAVSVSSESPSNARVSPPVNGGGGKDFLVECVPPPQSRRTSPRSRLSNSSTEEVKRVIPQPTRAPPPPPPPPRPPPPPPIVARANGNGDLNSSNEGLNLPLPVRPSSSRRQWVKPTCPDEIPIPLAEASNGVNNCGESVAENGGKPKLKPLHWDKVRASSDRAMVWDQLKSSSFQLDEDMIETLFCNSTTPVVKDGVKKPTVPLSKQENKVLDPKKSQNIAILLRALNVTREEVTEALLDGNPEGLGPDLLETLVKMAPSKEEELRLRDYNGDVSKLGSAERFLKALLDVPFAFKRVDAMFYRANFDSEVKYLRKSFEVIEAACDELKRSRLFLKLLEAVLKTGNRINVGTNRGEAKAFKLDTLLKLADVKGTDGKTTLLHFVVQEIIRSELSSRESLIKNEPTSKSEKAKEEEFKKKGLKMVAGLGKELANVKKAATMDSDVLSSYVSKLELGLDKIKSVLQLGRTSTQGKFFEAMKVFLSSAEDEIARVKAEERTTLALVKEITEYFHGNASKEEAHPFRIFMVVRDFLSVLDNVCREVERMPSSTVMGCSASFRMPASASMPALHKFNQKHGGSSDEDSSSM